MGFSGMISVHRLFFLCSIPIIELLFLFRMQLRENVFLRASAAAVFYAAVSLGMPPLPISLFLRTFPVFLASIFGMWLIFDVNVWALIFLCTQAHVVQVLAANLNKLICVVFGMLGSEPFLLHAAVIAAVSLAAVWKLIVRCGQDRLALKAHREKLMSAILTGWLIVMIDSLFNQSSMNYDVLCRVVLITSCWITLRLQYTVLRIDRSEVENRVVNQLLEAEKAQYRKAVESISEVSRQCHDLRYFISREENANRMRTDEMTEKIARTASFYDDVVKTGNEVIDTVLTEKNLFCKKNGVVLTYMVDAQAAAFMERADLYVLLENAFDNAIEAAMKCSEGKRYVLFRMSRRQDMLSIHMENSFETPPDMTDDLPRTTKADADKHGYGVRSIRILAQSYDGHAVFHWTEGVFSLDIIIPETAENAG